MVTKTSDAEVGRERVRKREREMSSTTHKHTCTHTPHFSHVAAYPASLHIASHGGIFNLKCKLVNIIVTFGLYFVLNVQIFASTGLSNYNCKLNIYFHNAKNYK